VGFTIVIRERSTYTTIPHESWCYPLASLGDFRAWLQDVYLEGGKFSGYLNSKVKKGELPPSVAQLAIATLAPPQISAPKG
jgi:hypothetical protein